jgi:hypothetical protein
MPDKEINDLSSKASPLDTDEIELQATGGGDSAKATLRNLFDSILNFTAEGQIIVGDGTTDPVTGSYPINRNLVINGDMRVAQRGTSFATLTASQYVLDRWEWIDTGTTAAVVTITQDTDVPTVAEADTKFSSSLKVDVTTAEDLAGADAALYLSHKIEARDCVFFGHGATGALAGKLSFWFKSTKTGIFTVNVDRDDASEKYSTEFTVATTDTWEKHSVTVPGDTGGTAIADDAGIGLTLQIMMAVGGDGDTSTKDAWNANGATELATANQVNLLDNATNNVFITGVQYEVGSVVTPFERRPFSQELTLCQRYYAKTFPYGTAPAQNLGNQEGAISYRVHVAGVVNHTTTWNLSVVMRATPTVTFYNTDAANTNWRNTSSPAGDSGAPALEGPSNDRHLVIRNPQASGDGVGEFLHIQAQADAEL